jgi:ribonucleoside-triphosphate reductase
MNDGKGGKKPYVSKDAYELIISGRHNVELFGYDIGFLQKHKQERLQTWLADHRGSANTGPRETVKVVSVSHIGRQATYCLTEPERHELDVQGVAVGNCVEQSLESYELCCLVESFPANHDNADDFMRTLKFAYLYAKTVTLLPTHNRRTNQVMLRNRRIGLSQSGIIQAFAKFGRRAVLQDFCNAGYNEVRRWDNVYSDWLCVPKSIKVTSVKPSGTISLVVGATPGIHHPEAATYWRLVRVSKDSVLIKILTEAGYKTEPVISDPERTLVVYFAVSDPRVRPVGDVSIWEQMQNAVDYQRYWADNQVSCTVKFKPSEVADIPRVLEAFEDQLKGISFLPHEDHGYAQAPYIPCSAGEVEEYNKKLSDADYSEYIYEAVGSNFCDSDKCVLPGA